jgi:glycerol kinase
MESDTGHPMSELRADGGATANRYLMQFQADILGKPVRRAKIAETTAMGAAMLAGLATGVWKTPQDLRAMVAGGVVFEPRMQAAERERLLAGWHDAVSRALTKASD